MVKSNFRWNYKREELMRSDQQKILFEILEKAKGKLPSPSERARASWETGLTITRVN